MYEKIQHRHKMQHIIYYFVTNERLFWLQSEISSPVVVHKNIPFQKGHLFYSVVPTSALQGILLAY